jgi:hypothetical protein
MHRHDALHKSRRIGQVTVFESHCAQIFANFKQLASA